MALDHVDSYYAATANDPTRYPRLEGRVKADVCVVGGGFSGVATALTMRERGYSVVLLEANRIGWGASGRNGGQMIGGISGEAGLVRQLGQAGKDMLHAIHYRGHEIIEERVAKHAIACDLAYGWMEAAARPKHMRALEEYYQDLQDSGLAGKSVLLDRKALEEVLPGTPYHGGMIDWRSGHLHPLNLVKAEARIAASLGVAVHEDSHVLELEGGKKPFARTAHGRVDAATIVLAGGAEHGVSRGRLRGLTFPTGSYIVATESLDDATVAAINPQRLAVADSNVVLDYYRITKDNRVLFGGRCNYSNRDPHDLRATLQPRLLAIMPALKGKRIDYAWGGRIDIVLTRIPAIGRLEPNVYYMQGYCGHGVNAAHIAAEIVSDAICGTTEKFDLFDRIGQWQLPVPRWMGNQMLALGMLYYRLRDIV